MSTPSKEGPSLHEASSQAQLRTGSSVPHTCLNANSPTFLKQRVSSCSDACIMYQACCLNMGAAINATGARRTKHQLRIRARNEALTYRHARMHALAALHTAERTSACRRARSNAFAQPAMCTACVKLAASIHLLLPTQQECTGARGLASNETFAQDRMRAAWTTRAALVAASTWLLL